MSGAPEKRQTVRELTAAGLSQRRACRLVGTSRSSLAYEPRPRDREAVVAAIKTARRAKPRWGYKRVHARLRRAGLLVNRKRVERLWRELGYALPARRPRKKVRSGDHVPITAAHPNHVWTYDFIFDATAGGRRLKILSVLDEFTREALALACGRSLTAAHVKRVLAELFASRGRPAVIRSDNGPEFVAFELTEWLEGQGADTYHIEPGKPWQNAYGESFHNRLRDECLNYQEFWSFAHVTDDATLTPS